MLAGGVSAAAGLYVLARMTSTRTPAYTPQYQASQLTVSHYLHQLMLWPLNLMRVLSESLTGQEIIPVYIVAFVLLIVGMVGAWRAGRRIATVVIVLYPLVLIVASGAWLIQPRYWLPVQALTVYMVLEGLFQTVSFFRRRSSLPARTKPLLITAVVFAAVVVGANSPKVLRWAVVYTWHSFRSDYYSHVRDGANDELHDVAEAVLASSGPQDKVAIAADQLSVFHFLTRRLMSPFPGNEHTSAEDAQRIRDFLVSDGPFRVIVLELRNGRTEFLKAMDEHLGHMVAGYRLSVVFDGEDYRVYAAGPAGRSATSRPTATRPTSRLDTPATAP